MRQAIWLVIILLIGVFLGIDSVEKNMHKMHGTEGADRAIQVTPIENGKVEIRVLGQEMSTPPVDEKQVQVISESVNQGGTFLAEIGNGIGLGIQSAARKFLETVFSWVY